MKILLNYADGQMAIIDIEILNNRENEEDKTSFIFEVDLEYSPQLHNRDDNHFLAPDMMKIEPEITSEK